MTEWGLFHSFPRIMGNPYRNFVAYDVDDVNKYIVKNKKCYGGVHASIYKYYTINYNNYEVDEESALVDKIFLDIDESGWLEKLRELDNWLEKNNIVRTYIMSGKGNQTLIGCNSNITNKKQALGNFQGWLQKKFDMILDPSNIGDLARSFRVPNVYNYKRERYCIPMTRDMIHDLTLKEIYEIATEPILNVGNFIYGKRLINLKKFDVENYFYKLNTNLPINKVSIDPIEKIKKLRIPHQKFPPCVTSWINQGNLGYKGRHLLLLYLRDQQLYRDDGSKVILSRNNIISILKHCLDDETYRHAFTSEHLSGHNIGENMKPILKTLSKLSYNMKSCEQIQRFGLCPEDCGREHPIYEY